MSFTYTSHVLAIICPLPLMHTCTHAHTHMHTRVHTHRHSGILWAEYPKHLAQSPAHGRCSVNVCRFQQGCLFHNLSPVQTPSGPLDLASSGTLPGLSPSSTHEPNDPPQSTSHPVPPTPSPSGTPQGLTVTCEILQDLSLTTPLQTQLLPPPPTAHLGPRPIKGSQLLNTPSWGFVYAVPSARCAPGRSVCVHP